MTWGVGKLEVGSFFGGIPVGGVTFLGIPVGGADPGPQVIINERSLRSNESHQSVGAG